MRKHSLLNTALNDSQGLGNIPSLITSITFLFVEYKIEYFAGMLHKLLKFLLLEENYRGIETWVYQYPDVFMKLSSVECHGRKFKAAFEGAPSPPRG